MTDIQALGREGIGLHINVGICHIIHEAGLTDVGVPSDNESTGVRVDLRESCHVLADLLQVAEGGLQLLEKSTDSTKGSLL